MSGDPSDPLEGIDPESVSPGAVEEADVRAALASSKPLVRQRGVDVCVTLARADVDAVRPVLDDVAVLTENHDVATALGAIEVLDVVAETDPGALDGRIAPLARAVETDLADVLATGAQVLGTVVVERPDLCAPHAEQLVAAVEATEPDRELPNFGDMVDDRVTQQTLAEHEQAERERQASGRQVLANVVVAVAETEPESLFDAVEDLVELLDDVDPTVTGAAVDALAELASADPSVVAPVRDPVVACLDHDAAFVRGRAVRVLGNLGDETAVTELRDVAESEPDENVRELAAETADFLDSD